MDGQNETQKINGTWNGMPCSIKKVWGKNIHWEGHEFSAEECAKLFADETIEFEAISKAGKPYMAKGKLEKQSFKDDDGDIHEYVGFTLKFDEKSKDTLERFSGIWNDKEVSIKKVWSGHEFTPEEQTKLLAGETIKFTAVSQKTGVEYKAKGKLAELSYEGRTFVGFKSDFS